ncbi:o-succinylbenzoate--CoA ligase [Zhihengliuella alba]|uniref:O-succinylbenzoate--CoA ligase n=1 Tax=Zhihengliuella alba TaxID=547018 RepID=A0ABP7DGX0_9MICC
MPTDTVQRLLGALTDALGGGPAVEPVDSGTPGAPEILRPDDAGAETAVVIRTSGSSGAPKRTALSVEALAASSEATARYLRAEGQWLLALPTHYVAGVSVLTRSLFAGTQPVAVDLAERFTPERFVQAASALTDRVRMTSLVPTQLQRLLEDPAPETLAVLQRFDAILVGGGRTPEAVRAAAARHGLRIHLTYGMSETCGGCVYDGVPLPGVAVCETDGRLSLGGPMVATGYLGDPERTAAHFGTDADGLRWFLTDDVGTYIPDPAPTAPPAGALGEYDGGAPDPTTGTGLVTVEGRIDDVVITGGVKVSAGAVQRVVEAAPGAGDALVVGIPDEHWGAVVAFAYTGDADGEDLVAAVRAELGPAAAPKRWKRLPALPLLPNGKPDRQAVLALLA